MGTLWEEEIVGATKGNATRWVRILRRVFRRPACLAAVVVAVAGVRTLVCRTS